MKASSASDGRFSCSRLYPVQPLGVNTSQIESLASYVCRLAREHLVTPATLLHRELAWWDSGQPQHAGQWMRKTASLRLSPSINTRPGGERWVRLLERLTAVRGLAECTATNWSPLFPERGFTRARQAWCPLCLAEDDDPYYRLSWSIDPVKACVRHRCVLVDQCGCCGSRVPVLHARGVPGFCPTCESKLARTGEPSPASYADEFDIGIAQLVDDFLTPAKGRPTITRNTQASPASVIQSCLAAARMQDPAELARLLNVSRITAWYWLRGKSAPGLPQVLRLCFCFKMSLDDFLTGRVASEVIPRGTGELPFWISRRAPIVLDEIRVAKQIDELLAATDATPPSFLEVCRILDASPRVLRAHFPKMCRDISARHKEWLKEYNRARKVATKEAFRERILQCKKEWSNPRRCDVVPFLPKPGILRSAAARKVFDQLWLELH